MQKTIIGKSPSSRSSSEQHQPRLGHGQNNFFPMGRSYYVILPPDEMPAANPIITSEINQEQDERFSSYRNSYFKSYRPATLLGFSPELRENFLFSTFRIRSDPHRSSTRNYLQWIVKQDPLVFNQLSAPIDSLLPPVLMMIILHTFLPLLLCLLIVRLPASPLHYHSLPPGPVSSVHLRTVAKSSPIRTPPFTSSI